MKTFSLAAVFCSCLLLTTSCSFGEDLEKGAITKKENSASQVQNDSSKKDKPSGDNSINNDAELYVQLETDQEIRFPKTKSVSIESKNNEDGQKILMVDFILENGEVEDFDFTYKWLYNNVEIIGEVDDFIPWNDDYKKGEIITVQIIPPGVDEESFLVTDAEFVVPNSPPVITSEPPTEIRGEDKLFEYKVEAEDPDGDEVEVVLKKSPAGMTIEPATGQIKWDFAKEKPGSEYKIEIVATDTEGDNYTQEITLTIPESEAADREQPSSEEGQSP
jgi:hypothetical protein